MVLLASESIAREVELDITWLDENYHSIKCGFNIGLADVRAKTLNMVI